MHSQVLRGGSIDPGGLLALQEIPEPVSAAESHLWIK